VVEPDPYLVLGLPRGATVEEMKRAYRVLVKKHHPDFSGRTASSLDFSRVVQAYRAIMIAERRKRNRFRPMTARGISTQGPARPQPFGGPAGTHATTGAGTHATTGAGTHATTGAGTHAAFTTVRFRQPPTDVFQMGHMLLSSREPALRAFAAGALGNSGRRTAYAFLRKALLDPEEAVVRTVVSAIGKLSILQSAGELAALYMRSGPAVRREILSCVRSILPPGTARSPTFDGFAAIANMGTMDSDPKVRAIATDLLGDGE
jgi:curved DNA-binding protein CbpA